MSSRRVHACFRLAGRSVWVVRPQLTTFAIIVAAVIGLFVFVFVAIHVYAYLGIWISSYKLNSKLRLRGRVLSRDEARARIQIGQGALFVEAPTMGWNVVRVWWTPTTNFSALPNTRESDSFASQADRENHSRFVDLDSGTASLVDGFVFFQRLASYLKRHFGISDYPFICTGAVQFERHMKSRQEGKA